MIYLDNAATTLIKPKSVYTAMQDAMRKCGNPGRGGHAPSMYASDKVYECRVEIAKLFGIEDHPERVVFTLNATHALNIAIKSILHDGGHAVISSYEHNSVIRPLNSLKNCGVTYAIADCPLFNIENSVKSFKECIDQKTTKCVIINHVSNVFGYELPIYQIDNLCWSRRIPMIIDASQSAGINEINLKSLKSTAFVCFPGHKSLLGPQGTGCLICCNGDYLYSITEGGTGSNSIDLYQPDFLPDIHESGTQNSHGIAALSEGVKYIQKITQKNISCIHKELTKTAIEKLSCITGIKLYTGPFHWHGVISFTIPGINCEQISDYLNKNNIFVRSGIHCSPISHKSAGTLQGGTVRISFSIFNTKKDIDGLCYCLNALTGKKTSVFY